MKLENAKKIAEAIVEEMKPYCLEGKILIGGSIRREKGDVNDIEIICLPKLISPKRRNSGFCRVVNNLGHLSTGKDLNKGKYFQIIRSSEFGTIKIDIFIPPSNNWGMAVLVRTGCSSFSKSIYSLMNKKGYTGEDFVHVHSETKEVKTFDTEEEVFDFLDLAYVEPKYRTY